MTEKPTSEDMRREAQEIVQRLAGTPQNWRENVTVGIERASRLTGYPRGTVKKIWYRQRAVIPAEIMDYLRALNVAQAERTRREIEATSALIRAREKTQDAIRKKSSRLPSHEGGEGNPIPSGFY